VIVSTNEIENHENNVCVHWVLQEKGLGLLSAWILMRFIEVCATQEYKVTFLLFMSTKLGTHSP
jgi:hypothetical protein